jgi:poly(3-hydroxyalkanoate) synthetase
MTQVHTVASIHANVILTAVRDFPLVMEMPVRTENQTIASVMLKMTSHSLFPFSDSVPLFNKMITYSPTIF